MKKLFLISTVLLFLTIFSSCDKCKECHCEYSWSSDMQIYEVCRDNFISKEAYNDYIENLEVIVTDSSGNTISGCECKADILW